MRIKSNHRLCSIYGLPICVVENPLYIWGNDGLGVAIGFTIEQRGNCEEQRDHYNAGHCSGQAVRKLLPIS